MAKRIECAVPLGEVELTVPIWTVPQEAFDYEHFQHRHQDRFFGTELLERGDDYVEVRYSPLFFGLKLPRITARATLRPPCEIEMRLMDGPMRDSRLIIDCQNTARGMVGKRTYVVALPDNIMGRAAAAVIRRFAPDVYGLARPFLDRIQADDVPAFERMSRAYSEDIVLSHGTQLRFAPGEAEARMRRVALTGFTRGCEDCGRYDLGFELDGHVRCSICDYHALHAGAGHEVRRAGAELACVCLQENAA